MQIFDVQGGQLVRRTIGAGGSGSGRHASEQDKAKAKYARSQDVHWDKTDPATHAFGKLYSSKVKSGGSDDRFDSAVKHLPGGKSGFGGSGETHYEHNGNHFAVSKGANGKGFWGTSHHITKVGKATE